MVQYKAESGIFYVQGGQPVFSPLLEFPLLGKGQEAFRIGRVPDSIWASAERRQRQYPTPHKPLFEPGSYAALLVPPHELVGPYGIETDWIGEDHGVLRERAGGDLYFQQGPGSTFQWVPGKGNGVTQFLDRSGLVMEPHFLGGDDVYFLLGGVNFAQGGECDAGRSLDERFPPGVRSYYLRIIRE